MNNSCIDPRERERETREGGKRERERERERGGGCGGKELHKNTIKTYSSIDYNNYNITCSDPHTPLAAPAS